jgi:CheY-like chemotaxis protein
MNMPVPSAALQGLRLFVVEDEAWIAMMIEDLLEDLGCTVVGVAGNLSQALSHVGDLATTIDGALLDVNLGGCEYSYPFADALIEAGVPFVFVTGYAPEFLEPRFRQTPILPKPIRPGALAAALADFPARNAQRARNP